MKRVPQDKTTSPVKRALRAKKKDTKQSPDENVVEANEQLLLSSVASNLIAKGPMGPIEIAQQMGVSQKDYGTLKSMLHKMICDGSLGIDSENRFFFQGPVRVIGKISIHPRGFGFVSVPGWRDDIFVAKTQVEHACHQDIVLIEVNSRREKTVEGRVLNIEQRGQIEVVATVTSGTKRKALAYSSMLQGQYIQVRIPKDKEIVIGDRILVKMIVWGDQTTEGEGILIDSLGHIKDASKDTFVALIERSIRNKFNPETILEAETLVNTPMVFDDRDDLREWDIITIDPVTAKDFDDGLSIQKTKKGGYLLGVHIADVAHYVSPGSSIDIEAKMRGNSTYFPGKCEPMLPHELADDLCSLREGVPRLTVSVIMEFDRQGALLEYEVMRSVILNKAQMTYEKAKQILDEQSGAYLNQLKLMVELCKLLKEQRRLRGAVDMNLEEVKVICDDMGVPTAMHRIPYDITHQMVEEFMIKANEVIARHLEEKSLSAIYRAHEQPSHDSLRDFLAQVEACHCMAYTPTNHADIPAILEKAQKTPFGSILVVDYIRSMKMAFYQPENIGHFGLQLQHYCHFTSPIRRYADLIVMRALFGKEEPKQKLQELGKSLSASERNSAKAENSVVTLKKLRILDSYFAIGKRTFFAKLVKVKSAGLVLEIGDISFEVFLHISQISREFLSFDPRCLILQSNHGVIYKAGDTMELELVTIDLLTQKTTWKAIAHYNLSYQQHNSSQGRHNKFSPRQREDRRRTDGNPQKTSF